MHLFRWTRGKGRGTSTATLAEPLFQWFSTLIALGVVGVLILIAIVLFFEAEASIRAFGWSFLGGTVWNPQPPLLFGAFPFVYGTLVTSALAIMIIPTISSVSREAFLAVPDSQREAALSLGATRWETTRLAVVRYARAGIFGAVILGLGRAVGETMAVTMTIGNKNVISVSLFDQGQTIASWIANNFTEAETPLELSAFIELGLVLMLMSLIINVFARLMVARVLRQGEGAA